MSLTRTFFPFFKSLCTTLPSAATHTLIAVNSGRIALIHQQQCGTFDQKINKKCTSVFLLKLSVRNRVFLSPRSPRRMMRGERVTYAPGNNIWRSGFAGTRRLLEPWGCSSHPTCTPFAASWLVAWFRPDAKLSSTLPRLRMNISL